MNKKSLLTLALPLLTATAAMAEGITETQAQSIAAKFIANSNGPLKAKAATAKLTLASQTSGHYTYNIGENGGFVIVAADDRAAAAVLGYADSGTFSEENMPENMRWWIEQYDRQVAVAASQKGMTVKKARASRKAIAPMLTTQWDQDTPYNGQCPTIGTSNCLTGCVATAMAQVMNYHKWPAKGTGSHSYTWTYTQDGTEKSQALSANFANSTYDWANMTDTYGSSSTTEEKDAVAKLMSDVGISLDMNYGVAVSTTSDAGIGTALHDYFGYKSNMSFPFRDYLSTSEWDELVYAELAASRPCVYGGGNVNGYVGHAFVCDGYDADGYYHFNWGWGGLADGYFLLSALDPQSQGNGGTGTDFNYSQSFTAGIAKDATDNPLMFIADSLSIDQKSCSRSASVTIGLKGFFSLSVSAQKPKPGLRLENVSTGESTYILSSYTLANLNFLEGYTEYSYPVAMATIPAGSGSYRLYPAVYDSNSGTWSDVHVKTIAPARYITLLASESTLKFADENTAKLSANGLTSDDQVLTSYVVPVTATISNSGGDYVGEVMACLLTDGWEIITGTIDFIYADMADGESLTHTFNIATPQTAGSYIVALLENTSSGYHVLSYKYVTVKEPALGELTISNTQTVTVEQGDTATFNFTATAGAASDYFGKVTIGIFENTSDYPYAGRTDSKIIEVKKGQSADVTISNVISLEPGTYIYDVYNHNNQQLTSSANLNYLIVKENTTAIASPVTTKTDGPTRIYTLDGKQVNATTTQGLPGGFYILRQGGQTRKVSVGK